MYGKCERWTQKINDFLRPSFTFSAHAPLHLSERAALFQTLVAFMGNGILKRVQQGCIGRLGSKILVVDVCGSLACEEAGNPGILIREFPDGEIDTAAHR